MALARLVVLMAGFVGDETVRERVLVALPALFAAFAVKLYVPAFVGVPLIFPAELRDRPVGRLPLERLHVMGVVPEALRVAL